MFDTAPCPATSAPLSQIRSIERMSPWLVANLKLARWGEFQPIEPKGVSHARFGREP